MSKDFSSLTDKYPEHHDPDFPDYSLPSGLSWSSEHDRELSQEECIRGLGVSGPLRLSPRLLLTLASPTASTTSREAPYFTDYTPEQVKVGYTGPSLAEDPSTRILRLKSPRPMSTVSSGLPLLQLSCLQSRRVSRSSRRADNLTTITMAGDSLNISIAPPVLPLCFANALLTLYAVHEPGVDCKLPLLGKSRLSLFTSIPDASVLSGCGLPDPLHVPPGHCGGLRCQGGRG